LTWPYYPYYPYYPKTVYEIKSVISGCCRPKIGVTVPTVHPKYSGLVPPSIQQLWYREAPVDCRTTMSSESVCQAARSWQDVCSFHTRLFGVWYFAIASVREFLDTPSYTQSHTQSHDEERWRLNSRDCTEMLTNRETRQDWGRACTTGQSATAAAKRLNMTASGCHDTIDKSGSYRLCSLPKCK
jgi:hypothetical protein